MDDVKKPVVLFTMVEAGLGHIVPITAVYNAFKAKYGDKYDVVASYVFSEGYYPNLKKAGESLSAHTKRVAYSSLYNKVEAFSYAFSYKFIRRTLDLHFKKARKEFGEKLDEIKPVLVMSSYYLPSRMASRLRSEGKTDTLIATLSPDTYIYPAWDRDCDLFFVWNDYAEQDAKKKGFAPEKVKKTSFMFADRIKNADGDKAACRKRLGINDRYTVLFTSGAYGEKRLYSYIKCFLKSEMPLNLIAMCGKNEKLKKKLLSLAARKPNLIDIRVVGFTDKIAEYMAAADVVIGKASTNTVMEVGFMRRPMILNAVASRLEEHTMDFCLKEGLAVKSFNPKKTVKLVEDNALNGTNYGIDFKNFDKYRTDKGAEQCADALYELLKKAGK